MKWAFAVASVATVSADEGSPIGKVIEMISALQAKVIKEGEVTQATYTEFEKWCSDRAVDLQQSIKVSKGDIMNLNANIEKENANIQTSTAKIEQLAGEIASTEADLAAATKIRNKENKDFKAFEADISETIDTLERAVGVIEKEFNMGASALVQFKHSRSVVQALSAMVSAEAISSSDGKKLTALVQSDSEDDDTGAPAAAAYEHGQGVPPILETLNGLLEKANSELEGARGTEKSSLQKFEMLAMSLKDQIKFANKELAEAKKSKAESEESKGTSEGDLGVTTSDLNEDVSTLAGIHHDCMSHATEFEAEVRSRGEELKALAEAKKIVIEATSLAQTSFLQLTTRSENVNFKVIRFIRDAAKKTHSNALAQLASRADTAVRFGSKQQDVFEMIKKDINDQIAKLKAEEEADVTEQAFCDKEIPEAQAKADDKKDEIEKMTAKIDRMTSESKILKGEAASIEEQLGELLKSQAQATKIRQEEKANFAANKPELEKAIAGIQKALKVLNEYYSKSADAAHGASSGASTGIIGLLEVCESDFSKELAEITDAENMAAHLYEKLVQENDITKLKKEADVKYKTKAAASLDQSVSEYTSDREGVETESAAVTEQLNQLKDRCTKFPPNYEERKAKREEEMAKMKESLEMLEQLSGDGAEAAPAEAAPAEAAPAEAAPAEAAPAEAAPAEAAPAEAAPAEAAPAEAAPAEAAPAEAAPAEAAPAEALVQTNSKHFMSVHRH